MGRFTVIPQNAFEALQMDAGVLLRRFNPAAPAFLDEDIICATTGGVNPSCVPTFSDLGEDVDNAPLNLKENKHLDGWECKMATTSLGTSPELIRMSLGCADIDSNNSSKIVPRADLLQSDFTDLWWVGDRADGGFVAIQLKNALSTGGFSLQTTKNGKGTIALELTGHVSIQNQKEVPMVFYSVDPGDEYYSIRQTLFHVNSTLPDSVEAGDAVSGTLTAEDGYTVENVIVMMGGVDVTNDVYTSGTGAVSIAEATGNIIVFATAVES